MLESSKVLAFISLSVPLVYLVFPDFHSVKMLFKFNMQQRLSKWSKWTWIWVETDLGHFQANNSTVSKCRYLPPPPPAPITFEWNDCVEVGLQQKQNKEACPEKMLKLA